MSFCPIARYQRVPNSWDQTLASATTDRGNTLLDLSEEQGLYTISLKKFRTFQKTFSQSSRTKNYKLATDFQRTPGLFES